ncbi:hypothetical protein PG996_011130 [Apiospora saccharicola]|uniref:Uncharacterized protein n=1 Tax=Apiospora saccharicola TaxID=335842 RepID=A0ABR1UE67_9PEZI
MPEFTGGGCGVYYGDGNFESEGPGTARHAIIKGVGGSVREQPGAATMIGQTTLRAVNALIPL